METTKKNREENLLDAQNKASFLFSEIENRNLIHEDKTEKEVNKDIYNLAFELFGIKKYWHKRIVRAGENTLYPYEYTPPNLTIKKDDIVFVDFGPIFEEWEADFGRTFVLGNDPLKMKMKDDISEAWLLGKVHYDKNTSITGSELYSYICSLAENRGWHFGQVHCGHLIGEFPHEKIQGDALENYIHSKNHRKMRDLDKHGEIRHWILEVHFVDHQRKFGGFTEEILSI